MNQSKVFQKFQLIEDNVKEFINLSNDIVNVRSLSSPRAIGDSIQSLLEEKFIEFLPAELVKNYNSSFARRAMADFAFEDIEGRYYIVDNKTHNLDTKFNMPNLTSVERLTRFYEDDRNYFSLLLVSYKVENEGITCKECLFLPIENLNWECLTIGALGWGQIQIANSNKISVERGKSRKEWMLELCDRLEIFYPNEIRKIEDRIIHFQRIRKFWEGHE
jgi:hypothetical protein